MTKTLGAGGKPAPLYHLYRIYTLLHYVTAAPKSISIVSEVPYIRILVGKYWSLMAIRKQYCMAILQLHMFAILYNIVYVWQYAYC